MDGETRGNIIYFSEGGKDYIYKGFFEGISRGDFYGKKG